MERVLDVYRRPFDPAFPVVCMDETPRQLIGETREPLPTEPGRPARHDYEYRRCGTCNVFMAAEPLAGKRMTKVTQRRTKADWARFLADIADRYPSAIRITLVMDNLSTHRPGALYETYPAAQAKALWDRFEFVFTPKHGSWLNIAERARKRSAVLSNAERVSWTSMRNACPRALSARPCDCRSNSSTPRYCSSFLTRWATAPGVTPSSRAALAKLWCRPATSKKRIVSSGARPAALPILLAPSRAPSLVR